MTDHPLRALFDPKSVAVVGITAAGVEAAQHVVAAVRDGNFPGSVELVQAGVEGPLGRLALPARVELVAIAGPCAPATDVLQRCAEAGAAFALLLPASGETSQHEAERRSSEALELRRRFGLRVVGPECAAVMRPSARWNASLIHPIGRPGSLALVSQSASVCSAILDWAEARHIGFSTVAALGEAVDVGIGEVLDYLALDVETRAVLLYLERVDHPRHFMSGLRALARLKPVIVVKAARHALSGDGADAAQDEVFDAALARAGAVRVATLPELFSTAELLSYAPRFWGSRLAIVTNSGGLGSLAADCARDLGLPLAPISDVAGRALGQLTAPDRSSLNPIDLRDEAAPDAYAQALGACLEDPAIEGVLVVHASLPRVDAVAVARSLAAARSRGAKPVLVCFMGGGGVECARQLAIEAGLPSFEAPESAVVAFERLVRYRRNQELLLQAPDVLRAEELDIDGARLIVEAALARGRTSLSQLEAKAVLRAFRIDVSPAVRARDADEALVAAQQIGFPVVLKIDSPDIAHKTALDGVRLNLQSAAQVRSVYRELTESVAQRRPDAHIAGVIVEPMLERAPRGALIARALRDPGFGPAIALGPAGVAPKLPLGRPAIGLPPLNTRLARELLAAPSVQLGELPERASDALCKVLLRLSDLVCELPELRALELDPLIANDSGAVALDARMTLQAVPASRPRYAHLAMAPYPRGLIEQVQLPDGTPITLRPIRPEDAQMEQDFVASLSLESRRFRFMSGLARLAPDLLIRFTQLDYDRELALVAVRRHSHGEEELGVARYVADADELGCEFAVVVADAWQKRGVASQLMRALIAAARERHFARMHGDVLADNTRMLRWMLRLGFDVRPHPDDAGVRLVTLQLAPSQ